MTAEQRCVEVLLDPVELHERLLVDRVDDGDRALHEVPEAVLVEPVEGGGGDPGAVERRRHDHDDLVGLEQHAPDGASRMPVPVSTRMRL